MVHFQFLWAIAYIHVQFFLPNVSVQFAKAQLSNVHTVVLIGKHFGVATSIILDLAVPVYV